MNFHSSRKISRASLARCLRTAFFSEFLENLDGLQFLNQQGPDPSPGSTATGASFTPTMQQINYQPPPHSAAELTRTDPPASVQIQQPELTSPTAEQMNLDESIPSKKNLEESSKSKESKDTPTQPILPAPTKKERFLLIAADQGMGSPNERLNRVIQAKYEAGLLKPYNYVKGYARLSKWMDRK